jgi:hypothetical protein
MFTAMGQLLSQQKYQTTKTKRTHGQKTNKQQRNEKPNHIRIFKCNQIILKISVGTKLH